MDTEHGMGLVFNSGEFHSVGQKGGLIGLTALGPKCGFVCFCLNHPTVFVNGLGGQKAVCTVDVRKTWVQISALPLPGGVTLGRLFNFYIFLICKMRITILTLRKCCEDRMRDYT